MLLVSSADFFFKINVFKKFFQEHYQSGKGFGPDLGTNCLQRFSADDKSSLTRKWIHPGTFQLVSPIKYLI